MVSTVSSKILRFLSGLRLDLVSLVDTGTDCPKSYADVVGRAIHQESWMKAKKKLNSNADEGQNEITHLNQSQVFGNRRSGGRIGFQQKKSNAQDKPSDKVGDARVMLAIRGRMGLVVKVGLSRPDQTSKPGRVLSSGHFVSSVRNDT